MKNSIFIDRPLAHAKPFRPDPRRVSKQPAESAMSAPAVPRLDGGMHESTIQAIRDFRAGRGIASPLSDIDG